MAVNIPVLTKQPTENRVYAFDYSLQPEIKDNAETISSTGTVTATPSGLTIGTPTIHADGKQVLVRISGGVDQTNYVVTNTDATTDQGNELEGEFKLLCRNL